MSLPRLNGAIRALEQGKPVFTAFCPPEVGMAQVMNAAPYDAVVFEMEHHPYDINALRDCLQYMLDRKQILKAGISDAAASLLEFMSTMGTGEAITFGEGVALPTRIKFDMLPPEAQPKSNTASFTENWAKDLPDQTFLHEVVSRWRQQAYSSHPTDYAAVEPAPEPVSAQRAPEGGQWPAPGQQAAANQPPAQPSLRKSPPGGQPLWPAQPPRQAQPAGQPIPPAPRPAAPPPPAPAATTSNQQSLASLIKQFRG